MITVRKAEEKDRDFWYSLDKHLPPQMFAEKVRSGMGYVLLEEDMPVGLMRWGMFWDNVPFCNLLYVHPDYQRKGYGRQLMAHWEAEMKAAGHDLVLVSTQADEDAQHFYRALGYKDCGCLLLETQAAEIFFSKNLQTK